MFDFQPLSTGQIYWKSWRSFPKGDWTRKVITNWLFGIKEANWSIVCLLLAPTLLVVIVMPSLRTLTHSFITSYWRVAILATILRLLELLFSRPIFKKSSWDITCSTNPVGKVGVVLLVLALNAFVFWNNFDFQPRWSIVNGWRSCPKKSWNRLEKDYWLGTGWGENLSGVYMIQMPVSGAHSVNKHLRTLKHSLITYCRVVPTMNCLC